MIFNHKIPPITTDHTLLHLLVEVGMTDINFLLYSISPFQLHGFYQPQLQEHIQHATVLQALKSFVQNDIILGKPLASVKICYNMRAAELIPTAFFNVNEKAAVLNVMHGKDFATYAFHEDVLGGTIKLAYRVPCNVYDTMQSIFAKSTFMHSTSLQINHHKNDDDALSCIVYEKYIKVLLFKAGAIQIATYFDYTTPLEVSYHLINVCQQFEVDAAEVALELSGMVTQASNLYEDVHKYFLHVAILPIPTFVQIAPNMQDLPHCFYNALTTLALCE